MPRQTAQYWWNDQIAKMRKACIKCKRNYQRKRKKHEEINCEEETRAYKTSRKDLVQAIKKAKEKCWEELCQEVERDLYTTIMKKLKKRQEIIGLELLGRT